jgi:hypothetical protein
MVHESWSIQERSQVNDPEDKNEDQNQDKNENENQDQQLPSLDAQAILSELRTLKSAEPETALPRLRQFIEAAEKAMPSDRLSRANLAAALTKQAIVYLSEGIERQQNRSEINRRFAVAIQRAERWVASLP